MYINDKTMKIGRIKIEDFRGSYRLRWSYLGSRYSLTVGKVSPQTYKVACAKAQTIDSDMTMEKFDTTLANYDPKIANKIALANKPINLVDIISDYQRSSNDRVSNLVQKNVWKPFNNFISDTKDPTVFELTNAQQLINILKDRYSVSFVETLLRGLINPAVNIAVQTEKVKKNPYLNIPLPKRAKRVIDCYNDDEIKLILEALKDTRYYWFIRMLALTGARPSELVALSTRDIKNDFIIINKTYTKVGGLKKTTKNCIDRAFPINPQVQEVLDNIESENGVLFPNAEGGYIDANGVRKRYWYYAIQNLIVKGSLDRKLRMYSLRSSFITRLIRNGQDIATVARIVGNTPQRILTNYLKYKEDFEITKVDF